MGDIRKAVLLRAAASAGALFIFLFSTTVVVDSLGRSGSLSPSQTVAAYVAGTAIAVSIASAIWVTWWSAYRSARR
jgi:hypothetical protein